MKKTTVTLLALGAIALALIPLYAATGGADKMVICHIPPGNPENAHTIEIATAAWEAHAAHGDYEGECVSECPDLMATSHGDGTITVMADGLTVAALLMRATDGEPVQVAELDGNTTTYVDTDTDVGTTYTYTLVVDGQTCALVEATAIPVFGLFGGALAVAASAVGFVIARRR